MKFLSLVKRHLPHIAQVIDS